MSRGGSISVVVASGGGLRPASGCVESFRAELDPSAGDELLVEEGDDSTLVPELWARGLEKASGQIVAFTIGSMVAAPGWAAEIRAAMAAGCAGVGGAIEPGEALDAVGRAVHLCRYSGYLLPLEERDVDGLPGDNAAYRRSDLERCREVWSGGFWETEVDPCLRRAGGRLRMTPRLLIRHESGARFAPFCVNRFRHGMRSGRQRGAGLPGGRGLLRAAGAPAVPFVLLLRIWRRASARGRAGMFFRALPVLFPFLCFWAAGEAVGYLRAPS